MEAVYTQHSAWKMEMEAEAEQENKLKGLLLWVLKLNGWYRKGKALTF